MQRRRMISVEFRVILPATRVSMLCVALALLAGCAGIPGDEGQDVRPDSSGPRVSALEAQGPLNLPFASPQRWLNFPMYHNDSAHAVDLGALRWQPDTLLRTASRYPLHGGESWPSELYRRAWYVYVQRLVDCQTGADAELSEALLDRDGAVLLERQAESAPKMIRDLGHVQTPWQASSEIGLACLAAADPQLLNQRRDTAYQPAPKLSYLPVSALLHDDVSRLRSKLRFQIDGKQLLSLKAGSASAILSDVGRQQAQWRRELHGPGMQQHVAAPWADEAKRQALERTFNSPYTDLPMRVLPDGEYERWEYVRFPEPVPKPLPGLEEEALQGAEVVALRRGSCLSNFALSTHYRWYSWYMRELLSERESTPAERLSSLQSAQDFCAQLRVQAASLDEDGSQPLVQANATATREASRPEIIEAEIQQQLQGEQTPEVRARILLLMRAFQAIGEVQQ